MKPLLAILLTVTQLASCGVAPTWICIARDGSISLALGPDDCNCPDCPEHSAVRASEEGIAPWLPRERDAVPSRVGRHWVDSCGCLHMELSHEQAPTVERDTTADRWAISMVSAHDMPLFARLVAAPFDVEAPGLVASSAPSLRADLGAMLSTVVLRL